MVYNAQLNGYRVCVINHIGTLTTVPVTSARIFMYGNTADYAAMIKDVVRRFPATNIVCVGFSMGGNLITKYLGEPRVKPSNIVAGISVCQGYDANRAMSLLLEWKGFRRIYLYAMTEAMKSVIRRWQRILFTDEVKRKTTLLESGAVAAGPVERLKLKVEASKARIRQLRIEQQELEAHVMDAKALLAEGQAQRDEAQLRLDRMIVRSPMDGVVIERLTAPGSVVNFGNGDHGSHIVHLYDPRKLQVRADVPLAQAAQVGVGHPAEIIVDVLPGTTFTGEVTRFVHKADLQKNTVEAKVRINDPSDLLKPDMLARVRILQPKATDSAAGTRRISRVFVPRDSVNGNGEVMVIESLNDGRGTTQRRAVDIGTTEIDGWIEIRSGLSPGDRIVLDEIAAGTLVRVEDE